MSDDKCIDLYLHACIYMDLYIHGSEITVSLGKCLCIAEFYSMCPSKFWALSFHVFSNWREPPMHTGWFGCPSCAQGDDSGFSTFALPRRNKADNKTPDKWDTACALTATTASQFNTGIVLEWMLYLTRSKTLLNTSFQVLDVPSALLKHNLPEPLDYTAGMLSWERKHDRKSVCPERWWMRCTQSKRNPDFLPLYIQSARWPAWQATAAEPGAGTWLLIKGFLSNNPLHISKSCCQEPWTSMGCRTTDKAVAEKSKGACIGQSERY